MVIQMKAPAPDILLRLIYVLNRGASDARYIAKDGGSQQAYELANTLRRETPQCHFSFGRLVFVGKWQAVE